MRILLITNAPFLQAGNQSIRRTLQGLTTKGFEFEVWSLGVEPPENIPLRVSFKTFSTPKFIKNFFKLAFNRKRSSQSTTTFNRVSRRLDQMIDYQNDNISQWLLGLPASLYFSFRVLIYTLLNYHSLREVDAIWGYERGGVLPAFIISRIIKKPLITSFQGTVLYFYWKRYGLLKTFLKLPLDILTTWLKADLVIMTDDGTRGIDVLLKLGHRREKILFIPNGVELEELNQVRNISKHSLGLGEELLFVVSARLVPHKRVDRALILAGKLLKEGIENFKLYIIGDGPDKEYLRSIAEAENIIEKVVFCGALPYQKTLTIIAAADMVWSFQEGSNLTNTIQDALALGKHVLVLEDGSLEGFVTLSPDLNRGLILTVPLNHFVEIGVEKIKSWLKIYKYHNTQGQEGHMTKIWSWQNRIDAIGIRVMKLRGQRLS